MEGKNKKYDLEDRLIAFAVAILELSEQLPNTRIGNHISNQIIISGTALRCFTVKRKAQNPAKILFIK